MLTNPGAIAANDISDEEGCNRVQVFRCLLDSDHLEKSELPSGISECVSWLSGLTSVDNHVITARHSSTHTDPSCIKARAFKHGVVNFFAENLVASAE